MNKRKQANKENNENLLPEAKSLKQSRKKSILTENQLSFNDIIEKDALKSTNEVAASTESPILRLKKLLKNTLISGSDSVSGEAVELPAHIGLNIKDIGLISLPLVEQQASELIQKSTINENIYKLDSKYIQIQHPDWNQQLNKLVKRISNDLGYSNSKVDFKLDHLVLFKQNASLSKQNEITGNQNDLIAKLIIQLPSVYTGGVFLVHSNQVTKYNFDNKQASFKINYVAFHSNLQTEMKEIKSGYRLALVYYLYSFDKFLSKNECIKELPLVINNYFMQNEKPIAILLENQYPTNDLFVKKGYNVLQGVDKDRFNLIKSSMSDQLSMFICKVDLRFQENDGDDRYKYQDQIYRKRIKELNKTKPVLTASEEENIIDDGELNGNHVRKSKLITRWYNETGELLFRYELHDYRGKVDKETAEISLEIFSNIINLNNDIDHIEKWIYDEADSHTIAGWDGWFLDTTFSRYVLTFWLKKDELKFIEMIDQLNSGFNNIT